MREATGLWEMITAAEGPEGRDAKWSHPDLLPSLPGDKPADGASPSSDAPSGSSSDANGSASHPAADGKTGDIDWDAELSSCSAKMAKTGENGNSEVTRHSQPAFSQFPAPERRSGAFSMHYRRPSQKS